MNKGLTVRTGQPHINRLDRRLLAIVQEGKMTRHSDHAHGRLSQGPEMQQTFRDKHDGSSRSS